MVAGPRSGSSQGTTGAGDLGIVVPYAGPFDLLQETVESVLAQSDPRWRLWVVEDGDQSAQARPWLDGIGDDRIVYAKNATTLGVAGNFQRCLDLADTDYLTFPGSDDRLCPEYVASVRRSLTAHPGVDLVQPGVRVIDDAGATARPVGDRIKTVLRPRATTTPLSGEHLLVSLMHGNWLYFPSLCWRRERLAALGFRQDLATVLDLEALARLVLGGGDLLVLDEVLFEYRRHSRSASSLAAHSVDRFVEERMVMREIAAAARLAGWGRASRAAELRITSRLHAALLVPGAAAASNWTAARALGRHLVRR